jgi:hypothetical protein
MADSKFDRQAVSIAVVIEWHLKNQGMIKNIPLKISNQLKTYPLLHDFMREIYCIFFPGIRATISKAFKNYKR